MTDDLEGKQFSVEMETGAGKTYVYTKTIFELNKRFGFTKFIIVVPSVAIREGVYKSFQITREHFGVLYNNVPCRYFIYNSARLSDVRLFATSANIEIMIINIDAKKAENVINQAQDRLSGESAMRFIRDTRPIVIIDEPQSVDNTPKAKEAIASLNPLCVLRYSATHREKVNLLFRLTPIDAYRMGLVKQNLRVLQSGGARLQQAVHQAAFRDQRRQRLPGESGNGRGRQRRQGDPENRHPQAEFRLVCPVRPT